MKYVSRLALSSWLAAFSVSCGNDEVAPDLSTDESSGDVSATNSDANGGTGVDNGASETNPTRPMGGNSTDSEPSPNGTTGETPNGTSDTSLGGETTGDSPSSPTSQGTTPGETSAPASTEPSGPPDGAYVPCSGSELPSIALEPFILPPKLSEPIHMSNPPGQPNMIYVVERDGAFKRFDLTDPELTATTLVTLSGVSTSGEMGFLSAALHPNFDGVNEKRAYFVYTPAQAFVIKEYEIDGDVATEVDTLFEFTGDTESNHNGGLALFGPDGYLYVGIGDGGGGNDQHGANGNGQNTNTHYGKILRLDIDNPDVPVPGNLTSEDVDGAMVDGRILHYGLRNPWRFSFDRVTGDLYIGDVGQVSWEEVDMIPAEAGPTNFGWAAREGFSECPGCSASLFGLPAVDPIFDYENPPGNGGDARSVTGGYVYRGNAIPGLYGRYVFADYQTSEFTILTAAGEEGMCDLVESAITQSEIREQGIASFAEDASGELYVISLNDGIFKFVPGP